MVIYIQFDRYTYKLTIRPGLTGTVPVPSVMSRCLERERSERNMSRFQKVVPGGTETSCPFSLFVFNCYRWNHRQRVTNDL